MNIGFFGDSYVDIKHRRYSQYTTTQYNPWTLRLRDSFGSPELTSGQGGSAQYYAIDTWLRAQEQGQHFDVAIFTFTWAHRLYQGRADIQPLLASLAECVNYEGTDTRLLEIKDAVNLYYKYLYDQKLFDFNYEQQVRWILQLPDQHPETKFIFLPNYLHARNTAITHFTKGVLFDFDFETVSLSEPNNPGPINNGNDYRIGHMSSGNHETVKDLVREVILNYETYRDSVYVIDYTRFNKLN